jgi:hypothetical protein
VRAPVAGLLALAVAVAGCASMRPVDRATALADCPAVEAIEPEAPLPERPNRWWWGTAEPGRAALRASYGLDGCPPVRLQ